MMKCTRYVLLLFFFFNYFCDDFVACAPKEEPASDEQPLLGPKSEESWNEKPSKSYPKCVLNGPIDLPEAKRIIRNTTRITAYVEVLELLVESCAHAKENSDKS